MTYFDANIFLRALTAPKSEETRHQQTVAANLFKQAKQGHLHFTCTEVVLHEVLYALTAPADKNGYGLPPREACDLVLPVLDLPAFKHPNKRSIIAGISSYAEHPTIDFSDNLTAASAMIDASTIASFDDDFKHFPSLSRAPLK